MSDWVVSIHVDHVFRGDLGELDAGEERVRDPAEPRAAWGEDAKNGEEGKAEAGDPPRKENEDEKPEDAVEALLGGGSHFGFELRDLGECEKNNTIS